MTDHLETTTTIIEHDIEKNTTTGATVQLTHWITTLKETKGFETILHDLEKLKTALTHLDGKEIHSLLEKLGHETVKASEKATEDSKHAIKKLGHSLLDGAKRLEKLIGHKAH